MKTLAKKNSQKGATAVEFALVLPFLLILVFGIIEFGCFLFDKAVITNASREGARAACVYQEPRMPLAEIKNVVNGYLGDNLISFGPGSHKSSTDPVVPDSVVSGDYLKVTVSYHYDFLLLPAFIGSLVGGTNIVAETSMRVE
ncbi:TadE family protein [uncultured Desulfuromonas sp.]|mgnify:CR=1 FL=1|uniref:TadE/TadG family type IV pilus assembly protein n=1 Tax=uncultured Desulfuromonas sp. TaxID=181013 RepID=UPI00262DF340|nr:TadE family protein [uncultured Desulfuromonas sp.]